MLARPPGAAGDAQRRGELRAVTPASAVRRGAAGIVWQAFLIPSWES